MDSYQSFGYSISGLSSTSNVFPEWSAYPIKSDLSNSSYCPTISQLDCVTISVLSNSQEYNSLSEAFPGKSPSNSSSLETDGSFKHSPFDFQENIVYSDQDGQYALRGIETLLMAPETNEATTAGTYPEHDKSGKPDSSKPRSRSWGHVYQHESYPLAQQEYAISRGQQIIHSPRPEKRIRVTNEIPQGDIRRLLIECARAISENRLADFEMLIQETRKCVSINGEPVQRLGAYMVERLVARHEASGTNIYHAMRCLEPETKDLLSYMQILYDVCPYFKFGYMAANGAIAEVIKNEDHIHIIDFQIAQGTQWVTLIQALAARPSGPPYIRITGIDDPVSKYARGNGLQAVGRRLKMLSEKFKIPLEFHAMPVYAAEVTKEMLSLRPREAVVVNFTLQLHHTADESVDVNNPRDGLLRMVKSLSPKVTTMVEQDSNTNTTPFFMRLLEALDYYYAMFESIDDTLPRDSRDRINVEQHCLAKDTMNIIACEGKERVERHELLGKWKSRLSMAGFRPYPLSAYVNTVIKSLLRCYSDKYTLVEKDGAMLLGWKDRNLISASAWN